MGYMEGFFHGVIFLHTLLGGNLICLPTQGIEMGQFVKIAVKFMEDRPAQLHEPARGLILASLQDAFPCASP